MEERKPAVSHRWKRYFSEVSAYLDVNAETKDAMRQEVYEVLQARKDMGEGDAPEKILGEPRDAAAELAKKFGFGEERVIRYSEYRSKAKLFGYPLIHVVYNRGGAIHLRQRIVAKGVVAIGPVAVGVLAIGGVAAGVLTFAGLGLGLLAVFAGAAFGGFFSFGALSISYFLSFGAFAAAHDVAIGSFAVSGNVAIGAQAYGAIAGIVDAERTVSDWNPNVFLLPYQVREFFEAVETECGGMLPLIRNFLDLLKRFLIR